MTPPHPPLAPRRKKWTEAEEKTLIEKYSEMVADGTLSKMKTREKRFRPIAAYVNSVHHLCEPIAYPWQWTWKDVSTKVQNMRHQYLLVKQKIKRPENLGGVDDCEEFDWIEGLTYWSNFLRYKEVFGDFAGYYGVGGSGSSELVGIGNEERENGGAFGGGTGVTEVVEFGGNGDFAGTNVGGDREMGLGFECDCDGEGGEENCNRNEQESENRDGSVHKEVDANMCHLKKKRKVLKGLEKRAFGVLVTQLKQLREMEARFEKREADRERERQRRERLWMEREREWEKKLEEKQREREEREKSWEKLGRERMQEWIAMEKEYGDRERRRREEALNEEREWEDRMNRRTSEWKKRIDEMLCHHRMEMGHMQTRILHEQQNFTSQLFAIFSQWTGHPAGSDHPGSSSHYLSHMIQNLHHVNGMVHEDSRVEGENQDDQFIVDE